MKKSIIFLFMLLVTVLSHSQVNNGVVVGPNGTCTAPPLNSAAFCNNTTNGVSTAGFWTPDGTSLGKTKIWFNNARG